MRAVPRTIRGVNETRNERAATADRPMRKRCDALDCVVGNTCANQRNVIGIREADANASRAQTYPHGESA
jgi:hypothetical protein